MYRLIVFDERVWRKDCRKIPKKILLKIIEKVQELRKEPWPKNIQVKKLPYYDAADFRLRVGGYRVLFNCDDDTKKVYLLRVLHRSKLY